MTILAIIHPAEEGGFWAEVPALPGCVTQAETREELEANLREAVEGWLLAGQAGVVPAADSSEEVLELAL
jgi:predicted RNase H-like HicB family nuclease